MCKHTPASRIKQAGFLPAHKTPKGFRVKHRLDVHHKSLSFDFLHHRMVTTTTAQQIAQT
jgi:hypothetical protein